MRKSQNWIIDMLDAIDRIEDFTSEYSFEEFCQDPKTICAVRDQLMVIGEAAKNVSDDIKQNYPQIPWDGMVGSRNVLIHQYFRTDPELLFANVNRAIGEVREILKRILIDLESEGA